MQATWVYRGRIKRAAVDGSGRTYIVDEGPANGMWLLFAHGRNGAA